jgi:hypothetical protein
MVEKSLPWEGSTVGDSGPYTADQWSDAWRVMFQADNTLEGIIPYYNNELVVTMNVLNISIDTGAAMVDGKFYENTVAIVGGAMVVVRPGAGVHYYKVVLRKTFDPVAGQTVRVALLGPNVALPYPTCTQNAVVWEIPLADILVPTGAGAIVVSDLRNMCSKLGKLFTYRQGGAPDPDWSGYGSTDYPLSGNMMIQMGRVEITIANGDQIGEVTQTFAVPFSVHPMCFATVAVWGLTYVPYAGAVADETQIVLSASRGVGQTTVGAYTAVVTWIAIGYRWTTV